MKYASTALSARGRTDTSLPESHKKSLSFHVVLSQIEKFEFENLNHKLKGLLPLLEYKE